MPDVIEKLVEILRKTRYEYRRYIAMKDYEKRMAKTDEECCAIDDSIVGEIPFCADHLIANGVTIQRWIPVAERLPENNSPVLVYLKNYTIQGGYVVHIGSYDTAGFWFLRTQPGITSIPVREWVVTHWMPLPEAPKGQ